MFGGRSRQYTHHLTGRQTVTNVTEIRSVFKNGRLVTTEETHETELCPGHLTQKFGNRDTFTQVTKWSVVETL